jgi:hypothetical protein
MPVRWAVSLGVYLVTTIAVVVATLATQWQWLPLVYAGLLLSGHFALYYLEYRDEYRQHQRLKIVPEKQLEALLQRRAQVMELYNNLRPKYENA